LFCDPSTSDTLFAQIRGSEVEYFHRDRLGATLALSSNTGALLTSYRYDVYGTPYASSGSVFVRVSDLTTDPLTTRLFTAREYDSETSLYHYRARTYSPTLGRFLQRDPVGTEDQINLYTYVANNPTNFTDPTGEFAFLAPLIPSFIG
jgi:RHS repeat-associated protein